jgi:hypothetical protein
MSTLSKKTIKKARRKAEKKEEKRKAKEIRERPPRVPSPERQPELQIYAVNHNILRVPSGMDFPPDLKYKSWC